MTKTPEERAAWREKMAAAKAAKKAAKAAESAKTAESVVVVDKPRKPAAKPKPAPKPAAAPAHIDESDDDDWLL